MAKVTQRAALGQSVLRASLSRMGPIWAVSFGGVPAWSADLRRPLPIDRLRPWCRSARLRRGGGGVAVVSVVSLPAHEPQRRQHRRARSSGCLADSYPAGASLATQARDARQRAARTWRTIHLPARSLTLTLPESSTSTRMPRCSTSTRTSSAMTAGRTRAPAACALTIPGPTDPENVALFFGACDAHSQTMCDYAVALFDTKTGEIKESVDRVFEGVMNPNGSILDDHSELLPTARAARSASLPPGTSLSCSRRAVASWPASHSRCAVRSRRRAMWSGERGWVSTRSAATRRRPARSSLRTGSRLDFRVIPGTKLLGMNLAMHADPPRHHPRRLTSTGPRRTWNWRPVDLWSARSP